jgi:hypothetical protein
MGNNGSAETLFVVASTDMEGVNIMMNRIREQMSELPLLRSGGGTLRVTADPVPARAASDPRTLEQQVWGVSDCVTEMIMHGLGCKSNSKEEENYEHAHRQQN